MKRGGCNSSEGVTERASRETREQEAAQEKKVSEALGKKRIQKSTEGCGNRRTQMKNSGKEEKGWNRRRGWRLRGRQRDQNQAETSRQLWEQNLILRHKHTNTGVCTRAPMHTQAHNSGLGGAHALTHMLSHHPKQPHYTWNINGQEQSAKMEMGETEGGKEEKVRKTDGWKL